MGAMAISTLAGARLILNAPHAPFLRSLLPFLKGFTVFYWATGTWWIPMLAALALWRYVYLRFPLRYDPLYWGAVFPLGMYAVATYQMSRAMGLGFLSAVPTGFALLAALAWAATFAGLLRHLARQWAAIRRGVIPGGPPGCAPPGEGSPGEGSPGLPRTEAEPDPSAGPF
jgi:tellurite resistance protein TehA-like permease